MIAGYNIRHGRSRILERIGFVNHRHEVVLRHEIHHFHKPLGVADADTMQVCIPFDQVKHGQPDLYSGQITDNIDMATAPQRRY